MMNSAFLISASWRLTQTYSAIFPGPPGRWSWRRSLSDKRLTKAWTIAKMIAEKNGVTMLSRENQALALGCVFIEVVLVTIFSVLDYEKWTAADLSFWRTVLIVPLLWNLIHALWKKVKVYKILLLAAFVLIWLADMLLIRVFIAGLAVFLVAHILLGANYHILYKNTHNGEYFYA
ncbi:MAG: hypothetical protein IPM54_19745 [Polyangiaceae bacterium]|nr:hypothetical protein [Polyangiaceae bacterium]